MVLQESIGVSKIKQNSGISHNKTDTEWESHYRNLPFEFCSESSLHGLRYIGGRKQHCIERIFWSVAFLISAVVAILLISQIWEKYRKTPVITVIQPTETTIDLIPFPAISICNSNNVIRDKAEFFIERLKANVDDALAYNDLYLLDHICQTSTTFSEGFNFSLNYGAIHEKIREQVIQFRINHPNQTPTNQDTLIAKLLGDVSQKCTDMILLCMWNDEARNCSELFREVETDFGYCCTFNMVPTSLLFSQRNTVRAKDHYEWESLDLDVEKLILVDDGGDHDHDDDSVSRPKFPYHQYRPGKSSGLSVLLDPDLDSYFCTNTDSVGFLATARLPLDYPKIADEGVAITPNSETFLKIHPEIIMADPIIRNFPLIKRNCYFGTEYTLKYYKYYTISNCEDECIANITFQECNCVRYYMPPFTWWVGFVGHENQKLCGISKYNCTQIVRKRLLQNGIKRKCRVCLPTCTEIQYHMSTSYMPLRQDISLWEFPNGSNAEWFHKNVSILHVHFSVDSTYSKLRTELYGFIDLLSNTGGLLGLCLGFSALSLLEILYYFSLRLFCVSHRGQRMGDRINIKARSAWDKAYNATIKRFKLSSSPYSNTNVEEFKDCIVVRDIKKEMRFPSNTREHSLENQFNSFPHYLPNRMVN